MESRTVVMVSMPLNEFEHLLEKAVNKALETRFEPLRKQFEDRLISLSDAAEKLKVTKQTMYNLEKRKELMPVRIGKKVMYRESDITVYLRAKEE